MIIDKIRKLLALARNESATEAEAMLALKRANDLMLKHGIEQDQVDEQDELIGMGLFNSDHSQKWHQMLAIATGQMYGCTTIFDKSDNWRFIGREEANEAAQLTFLFIIDQVNALYRLSLPRGLSKGERAQYRRDFKHSCAARVGRRIRNIIEESMTDEGAAAIGCTALVVRTHRQQRFDEASGFAMKRPGTSIQNVRMTTRLTEAGVAGKIAGDQVQINKEVE